MIRAQYVRVLHASAAHAAARWKAQYLRDGVWYAPDREVKYAALLSLGENPTIEAVAEIIGNKSWSFLSCSSCSEYVRTAVQLGETYEDGPKLCRQCITEAAQAMKETAA